MDIRIDLSFLQHRKRKKLMQELGPEGVLALIDLWLNTRQTRPKGVLYGLSEIDIALDAQWSGDPVRFCAALVAIGFLDRSEEGVYSLHNWSRHQPFAFFEDERKERARKNAEGRWRQKEEPKREKKTKKNAKSVQAAPCLHATGTTPPCHLHASGIQVACNPLCNQYAPSPIPSPSPNPKRLLSEAERLATLLFSQIILNQPGCRLASLVNGEREITIQRWTQPIDLLIRKDRQEPSHVEEVILWCSSDDFWGANILSGSKLREKFDTLCAQMKRPKGLSPLGGGKRPDYGARRVDTKEGPKALAEILDRARELGTSRGSSAGERPS